MTTGDVTKFATAGPQLIPGDTLTAVPLSAPAAPSEHVALTSEGIVFRTDGWYEILMAVEWDNTAVDGTRFSHTRIPDQEPLHSEAINAAALAQISDGRQLLRA